MIFTIKTIISHHGLGRTPQDFLCDEMPVSGESMQSSEEARSKRKVHSSSDATTQSWLD